MEPHLLWALRLVRRQTLEGVRDLAENQGCLQASPDEHHPAWIVGHLLLADRYLLHLLGTDDLPPDFERLLEDHGPGSAPRPAGYRQPLARLAGRLAASGARRIETLSGWTDVDLARPLPDPALASTQPTFAHHLQALVFHEGHHGGQLAAWRRRQGLPTRPWVFAPE